MNRSDVAIDRVAALAGYALFGAAGAAVASVALARPLNPIQAVVYDAFYLVLGPWTATEAASILHIAVVGVLSVAAPTLVAERLDGDRLRELAAGAVGVLAALLVALVAAGLLGVLGLPTVLVAVVAAVVAALAGFRALGASTGGTAAFAGSLPVLALLLFLLAFGLGWGGGYDAVAEPVDPSAVDGPVADFGDAPAVREDLFSAAACDPADDGVCRLTLRGYEHERRAARVLARHGVRCPFVNTPRNPVYDPTASFFAEHDDQYYRVTCEAYGD